MMDIENKIITIVSGLPRSGTSMMMKMLEAGGMNVLIDDIRKADEDNPKGYYEYENVKIIQTDSSWLSLAEGKVFKMVSQLLKNLPVERKYKIIFMKRNFQEMIASQNKMLDRLGKERSKVKDEELALLYQKHLSEMDKWLTSENNIEILYMDYNDILINPDENVLKINKFLKEICDLDINKMKNIIDPSLYRQRRK